MNEIKSKILRSLKENEGEVNWVNVKLSNLIPFYLYPMNVDYLVLVKHMFDHFSDLDRLRLSALEVNEML